jgi:lipid II:glycine glycyltransferase (peptidoglycan interpeptide bridge formation enzyme)
LKPYKNNWKKNIGKAAKILGLSFQEVSNPAAKLLNYIAQLSVENSEIKHLSYHHTQKDLLALMSDNKYRLFTANINGKVIAARIVFVNQQYSYDVFTANGYKSREYRGVTHYLCNEIFEKLHSEGVVTFDFSRIPIGRKGAEGVCLFKSGSNGVLIQYNGQWLYTKKNSSRYIIYFVNKFIRKKYEY